PDPRTLAVSLLTSTARPEIVREHAHAVGVVKRQGKVDTYALLMVVVLGLVVRGRVSIAQLGHIYGEVTGSRLARSSFWDRLTPSFARLVCWLLDRVVADARRDAPRPPGVLGGFTDVLVADSTVVKVHDSLR